MNHVESAGSNPVAGGGIACVDVRDQRCRAAMLGPGEGTFVMFGQHGVDHEAGIAIARCEQDDVMPACGQAVCQIPAVRFHPAHERLRNPLTDMRKQCDPHAATLVEGSVVVAARASSMRMTVVVLA